MYLEPYYDNLYWCTELLSYRVTELQSYRVTKLQSYWVTEYLWCKREGNGFSSIILAVKKTDEKWPDWRRFLFI